MDNAGSTQVKASKAAQRNARRRKQDRSEKEKQRVDGASTLVGEWTYGTKDDRTPFWKLSLSIEAVSDSAGSQIKYSKDGLQGLLTLANGWHSGDLYHDGRGERTGSIRLQFHEDTGMIHSNFKPFPYFSDYEEEDPMHRWHVDDYDDCDSDEESDLISKCVQAAKGDIKKAMQLYEDMQAKKKAKEKERKDKEKERKAKAQEAAFARAPWQDTIISRRLLSISQAQQSVDMWSALVQRRASVIGAYVESQGAQSQARYLTVWPAALQYLGISERARTLRVCSGFRAALLKSIDIPESIEFSEYMGNDPICRSPEIFEVAVGSFVTSASVKVAKLRTDMVTDTMLRHILTTCPNLEALDLRKACLSDSGSAALILKTCTMLRSLKLSFPYITKCPQSNTWHHAVIDALAKSPGAHLTELAIERFSSAIASRRESGELELGTAALSRLLTCLGANLLSLSLANWPLSDELGLEIGKTCSKLQVLHISDPRELCDRCTLTPAGLAWIAEGCSCLKAVSLRQATGAISEESLAALSGSCQDLVELDLSGCWDEFASAMYTVTDAVFEAAVSCGMKQLAVLDLYMTETSDLTLLALAANCPGLRRLDISTCASDAEGDGYGCDPEEAKSRAFTDEGVVALARGCCRLEWLNIHMCLRLTDKAIAALADHCRQLSYLDMSGGNDQPWSEEPKSQMVTQYTDTSMLALKDACPALRHLNVAYCPHISSSSLSDLQASRQGLEIETTRTRRSSCLELLADK